MSEHPGTEQPAGTTRVVYTADEPNPILHFLQRPRIMLLLLAGWSLLGVLTQAFTNSGLFLENHNAGSISLDGALGGFAFGWEGIPLAAVYIYAFRHPLEHRPVFWLALIHMAAISASQVFHLGKGDFSFESVAIPLFGSVGIGGLVFLHLFHPRTHEEIAARTPS
jgi:hypothetical protein